MSETPVSKFRLSDATLADLDALAASLYGNRSHALREALAYWRAQVERAGRENGDQLNEAEWILLVNTGDPNGPGRTYFDEGPVRNYCQHLAGFLATIHHGRPALLPSHREEQQAGKKLAAKIARWGVVRGYALISALRYYWQHPNTPVKSLSDPKVWQTPVDA